jgi:hypothetical protein
MKSKFLATLLLTIAFALVLSIAAVPACSTLQTPHQNIGAACETIASAVDTATAAKQAGKISKADLQRVVDVATPTAPFCQPPAESLSASDYATLAGVALRIAALPGVK